MASFEQPQIEVFLDSGRSIDETAEPIEDREDETGYKEFSTKDYSPAQETIFVADYQNGDVESGEKLVKNFTLYINNKAKDLLNIAGKSYDTDLLDDLIQEGEIAVLEVVGRFDFKDGITKINARIQAAITNAMRRLLKGSYTLPLSLSVFDELSDLRQGKTEIKERGSEKYATPDSYPLYATLDVAQKAAEGVSLQSLIELENKYPFAQDIVVDKSSIAKLDPELVQIYGDDKYKAMLPQLLEVLNEREALVIELTLGLHGKNTEEDAHLFYLTKDRIRQIQIQALRKMRKKAKALTSEGGSLFS